MITLLRSYSIIYYVFVILYQCRKHVHLNIMLYFEIFIRILKFRDRDVLPWSFHSCNRIDVSAQAQ